MGTSEVPIKLIGTKRIMKIFKNLGVWQCLLLRSVLQTLQ